MSVWVLQPGDAISQLTGDVAGDVAGLGAFRVTSRRLTSSFECAYVRPSALTSSLKPD
jgi:hypothetical protein